SNVLTVRGVQRLRGGEWRIACEHIEVASFIGLAAVTGGDVVVEDVVPEDLAPILPSFERLGVHVELDGSTLRVPPGQELVVQDDLGGQIPKIEDGPWPAFPADLTSIALAVETRSLVAAPTSSALRSFKGWRPSAMRGRKAGCRHVSTSTAPAGRLSTPAFPYSTIF